MKIKFPRFYVYEFIDGTGYLYGSRNATNSSKVFTIVRILEFHKSIFTETKRIIFIIRID